MTMTVRVNTGAYVTVFTDMAETRNRLKKARFTKSSLKAIEAKTLKKCDFSSGQEQRNTGASFQNTSAFACALTCVKIVTKPEKMHTKLYKQKELIAQKEG